MENLKKWEIEIAEVKETFKFLQAILRKKSYDDYLSLSFQDEDRLAVINTSILPSKHFDEYLENFLKEYKEGTPEYIAAKIGQSYVSYHKNKIHYDISEIKAKLKVEKTKGEEVREVREVREVLTHLRKLLIKETSDQNVSLIIEGSEFIITTSEPIYVIDEYLENFLKEYKEGTPEYIAAKIGQSYINLKKDYYEDNYYDTEIYYDINQISEILNNKNLKWNKLRKK